MTGRGGGELLVVTGLRSEAKVASGTGAVTVAGGGDRAGLEAQLVALDLAGVQAVVSFGLAGALDPALPVGAIICPEDIAIADGRSTPVDPSLHAAQVTMLRAAGLHLATGTILGVDAPVLGPAAKAALRERHGAVAVDMESHVAAAFATRHGLRFAALRVVSDGAGRELPAIAGRAMRPNGSVDVLGVLAGLARDPAQMPALLATARDAAVAFRALRRVRGLLGPGLGLHL